eukprot:1950592-Pyramimonas_sp.AAC.1
MVGSFARIISQNGIVQYNVHGGSGETFHMMERFTQAQPAWRAFVFEPLPQATLFNCSTSNAEDMVCQQAG